MKIVALALPLVLFLYAGLLSSVRVPPFRSVCSLPKDAGPCYAYKTKYHFDLATQECKKFIYGGCRGNANRFDTEKDCQEACTCFLSKDPGPCKGYFPRFHFNYSTQKCDMFIYGGCQGNANNFNNTTECYKTCPCNQFQEIPRVNLNTICYLPKVVGPCRARIPRYFYNKCTKRCEFFYYGGCHGNKNNFKNFKECNTVCYYPPVRG